MTRQTIALYLLVPLAISGVALLQAEQEPAAAHREPPQLKTIEHALGPGGLITDWLALGYLPGRTDEDRLAASGGETNVVPYGGQDVVLPGSASDGSDLTLTWKTARTRRLEIPYYMYLGDVLTLFVDPRGQPVEDATAYLYTELESASEQQLRLRLTGGEPIRFWLNGVEIPMDKRERHFRSNGTQAPLALQIGCNRILIRMQNRHGDEAFAALLVDESGKPPQDVRVIFNAIDDPPAMPERYLAQDWNALTSEIPPVAESEDAPFFGANLGRTMTLLETGGQTRRPVRILFYGQSITAQQWVWFLIRQLRARYPHTDIQAENRAISGWQIHKLRRTIKHDILRNRPDLVVLHAYGSSSWDWEGILQKIRRETTADIMVRTAHIAGRDIKYYNEEGMPLVWREGQWKTRDEVPYDETKRRPVPDDDSDSLMIRRLARKYGAELVEGRKEWLSYIREHGLMQPKDLCSDGLHLNREGSILMAQLYERHFTSQAVSRPWFKRVRRYEAMRPMADRRDDEIQLIGDGWNIKDVNCATSTGHNDKLKLTFYGNRVDLVMPQSAGSASILIDGKKLSELNLLQGPRPGSRGKVPAWLMTYYLGDNAIAEDWVLRITHMSGNGSHFRFTLTGSITGPDGEGDNRENFVSNSGRIRINHQDFNPNKWAISKEDKNKTEVEPVTDERLLTWSVRQPFEDVVHNIPRQEQEERGTRYGHPFRYVTIIDGLPQGEHELTLIPAYSDRKQYFSISAVEVHRPPLW